MHGLGGGGGLAHAGEGAARPGGGMTATTCPTFSMRRASTATEEARSEEREREKGASRGREMRGGRRSGAHGDRMGKRDVGRAISLNTEGESSVLNSVWYWWKFPILISKTSKRLIFSALNTDSEF